jgi:hypothetical protein
MCNCNVPLGKAEDGEKALEVCRRSFPQGGLFDWNMAPLQSMFMAFAKRHSRCGRIWR